MWKNEIFDDIPVNEFRVTYETHSFHAWEKDGIQGILIPFQTLPFILMTIYSLYLSLSIHPILFLFSFSLFFIQTFYLLADRHIHNSISYLYCVFEKNFSISRWMPLSLQIEDNIELKKLNTEMWCLNIWRILYSVFFHTLISISRYHGNKYFHFNWLNTVFFYFAFTILFGFNFINCFRSQHKMENQDCVKLTPLVIEKHFNAICCLIASFFVSSISFRGKMASIVTGTLFL